MQNIAWVADCNYQGSSGLNVLQKGTTACENHTTFFGVLHTTALLRCGAQGFLPNVLFPVPPVSYSRCMGRFCSMMCGKDFGSFEAPKPATHSAMCKTFSAKSEAQMLSRLMQPHCQACTPVKGRAGCRHHLYSRMDERPFCR